MCDLVERYSAIPLRLGYFTTMVDDGLGKLQLIERVRMYKTGSTIKDMEFKKYLLLKAFSQVFIPDESEHAKAKEPRVL